MSRACLLATALLLVACGGRAAGPTAPAAPVPAAAPVTLEPITLPAGAPVAAFATALRARAKTLGAADTASCFLLIGRTADGAPTVHVTVGADELSGAFTCDLHALSHALAGRAIYLETEFVAIAGDGSAAEVARLDHFGAPGQAYLGRPLAGISNNAALDGGLKVLRSTDGDPTVLEILPASGGEKPRVLDGSEADLSWPEIQDAVSPLGRALARCFDAAHAPPAGAIVYELVVGADGAIADARLLTSTLATPALDACALDAARALRFPKPHQGKPLLLSLPIVADQH
jgi:hypothetical protein